MLAQRLSNCVARTAELEVAVPLTRPCIARQEASFLPSLLSISLSTNHLSIQHRQGCVLLHSFVVSSLRQAQLVPSGSVRLVGVVPRFIIRLLPLLYADELLSLLHLLHAAEAELAVNEVWVWHEASLDLLKDTITYLRTWVRRGKWSTSSFEAEGGFGKRTMVANVARQKRLALAPS
jgi:hypothetical protein